MHAIIVRDERRGTERECPPGTTLRIGRDSTAGLDLTLDDPHVSRRHCELTVLADGRVRIVDRSQHGTFVNGVRVANEAHARPGDRILLGGSYPLTIERRTPATHANPSEGPQALFLRDDDGKLHRCAPGVRVVLGRELDCDIVCDDPHVSRRHCEVETRPTAGSASSTRRARRGLS